MTKKLDYFKPFLTDYTERITEPSPDGAKNKYICPLPDCKSGTGKNRSGAFSITGDGLSWKCFSCQRGGDIADLVKYTQPGADTNYKALEYLNRVYGDEKPKVKPPEKTQAQLSAEEKIKDRDRFIKELEKNPEALSYLKGRGLTANTIKKAFIGYDPERKAVIIPYDRDFSYYIARTIKEPKNKKDIKYYKPKTELYGAEPVFNRSALEGDKPVFITEAQICALSIIQEMNGQASAIALGGTGEEKLKRIIEAEVIKAPALILCLDNDEAGEKNAEELENYLTAESTRTHYKGLIIKADWSGYTKKDPNELLQTDKSAFKSFLERAISKYLENEKNAKEREIEAINFYNANNLWKRYRENDFIRTNVIKTAWGKLDEYLGGGIFPSLYILGALSSLGKTTFLVQLADMIATASLRAELGEKDFQENHILYFTLEQSPAELIAKSLSRTLYTASNEKIKVNSQDILIKDRYDKLTEPERQATDITYRNNYANIGKYIWYYESAGAEPIGVQYIENQVKAHYHATGIYPLVFIDYLQILKPYDEARGSDKEKTDRNVSELKKLSAKYNIPVFCLSSFNRASYNSTVSQDSFKESGGIEYGADILLALEPLGVYDNAKDKDGKKAKKELEKYKIRDAGKDMILKILKNRNGALSYKGQYLKLSFQPKYSLFNLDSYYTPDES